MAAAFADDLTKIVLGIAVLRDQLLIAQSFVERIEIAALDVLDDGDFERGTVIDIANENRDVDQAGELCRTPATFTGNNLEVSGIDSLDAWGVVLLENGFESNP